MNRFILCFSVFALFSQLAMAESGSSEKSQSLMTTARPSSHLLGTVELRPSYASRLGEIHTENFAQLGWQFTPLISVFYRQQFNTNVFDPTGSVDGLNLYTYEGSLRTKVNNIWKSEVTSLSLSYEGRIYVPTFSVQRDAGMVSAIRNYLKLKKNLSPSISIVLEEIPILHWYNRAGTLKSNGSEANPFFENRIYLGAEFFPVKGVKLYFPFILNNIRYSNFDSQAKFNNSWGHKLWIWPELTLALDDKTQIGVAFYSDNLIDPNFQALNIGAGLEKGVSQMMVSVSL